MLQQNSRTSPGIDKLLETILPDGASDSERMDFARGLTILAELLGELETDEVQMQSREGAKLP
ncbi:hypothetical protein [Paracoccus denitrificans]|uniref:hypothetical protein n=1 Tax=Paracoccus denitrificans TaxID=266 RepID=UPI00131A0975|nr:hypothetical protein [Paracoccus denitrificans]